MDCSLCKISWKAEDLNSFDFCPFCGQPLGGSARKPSKESFHYVWGTMHEETLRKKKGPFDQRTAGLALENYLQAVKEDSKYSAGLAAFLEKWPVESPLLEDIEKPASVFGLAALEQLPLRIRAAAWLYGRGLIENSPQCGQRLLILLKNSLPEDAFFSTVKVLRESMEASGLLNDSGSQTLALKAAFHAALKEYPQATRLLCHALNGAKSPVWISSPRVFEDYCGLPSNPDQKADYIRLQLEKGCLKNALNCLFRPTSCEGREFEHQSMVFEQTAEAVIRDFGSFEAVCRKWLNEKMFLRGMHLFLQMMLNGRPELKDPLQPLLDLHYEKVYMQPYSWIEKTDWMISRDMLGYEQRTISDTI
ncbi:MAG: hypothetical protein HUJ54_01470 [Erysipelotrichaceae bacterium]|nr:hypothetical protein [Erysipelotrichaceae bacterium]